MECNLSSDNKYKAKHIVPDVNAKSRQGEQAGKKNFVLWLEVVIS